MTDRYDVAVVGAGLLGVYTAWRLAAAGASVIVLDKGTPGHQSTGRSSGGLRRQFATSYEIALSTMSRVFHEQLERDPDFPGGIDRVGYVFLADRGQCDLLRKSYDVQRKNSVPVEWLEPEDLRQAFPYCDLADVACGTITRDDGFINPWDVHQWTLRHARILGVTVRSNTEVHAMRRDRPDWITSTTTAAVRSGQVVLAAGAWTGKLARSLRVSIPVSPSPRVKVRSDLPMQMPPTMPLITDLSSGAYVRSEQGCALVGAKPTTTPRGHTFDTGLPHLTEIMGRATTRFPSLADAGISGAVTGLYEITPDGLPIAGAVSEHVGLYVVAGFNGHGIMHGPAVADAVCDVIAGSLGRSTIDLAPLAPDRFAGSRQPNPVRTLL
jgi:sarcosine oxidase subunit beta